MEMEKGERSPNHKSKVGGMDEVEEVEIRGLVWWLITGIFPTRRRVRRPDLTFSHHHHSRTSIQSMTPKSKLKT